MAGKGDKQRPKKLIRKYLKIIGIGYSKRKKKILYHFLMQNQMKKCLKI